MLDDCGRLDLKLPVIVSVMGGYEPPEPFTVAWVAYYTLLVARIDEMYGPDAWDTVTRLAGVSCDQFDEFDGFRNHLHSEHTEDRQEAIDKIRAADPENFDKWFASLDHD